MSAALAVLAVLVSALITATMMKPAPCPQPDKQLVALVERMVDTQNTSARDVLAQMNKIQSELDAVGPDKAAMVKAIEGHQKAAQEFDRKTTDLRHEIERAKAEREAIKRECLPPTGSSGSWLEAPDGHAKPPTFAALPPMALARQVTVPAVWPEPRAIERDDAVPVVIVVGARRDAPSIVPVIEPVRDTPIASPFWLLTSGFLVFILGCRHGNASKH